MLSEIGDNLSLISQCSTLLVDKFAKIHQSLVSLRSTFNEETRVESVQNVYFKYFCGDFPGPSFGGISVRQEQISTKCHPGNIPEEYEHVLAKVLHNARHYQIPQRKQSNLSSSSSYRLPDLGQFPTF